MPYPTLIQGNDGQLVAVWQQNDAGKLLGDEIDPDKLMVAVWNGSSWSSPQTALDNMDGLLDYTLARHNNDTMTIIYSQDTDSNYGTPDDAELFQVIWNGASWGSTSQLTTDTEADNNPTLFYTDDGQPQLLWMKGDTLYGLMGDLSGTPKQIATDGAASMLAYTAAQNAEDNLALIWQGYSDEGVDIFYAVYNAKQNTFSERRQLTQDEPLEKFMAPTFAPTGELVVAYNKVGLVEGTVEITPDLILDGVTTFGQTDLYVLRETLDFDVSQNQDVYLPLIVK